MQMPEFGNLYAEYCRRCKLNGAMDFDDLLLQTNFLFRDHPEVLARYQERFQYVLVDEYQDTNNAQYIIVRRLAQHHSRICVVGDDAQSIYSFRGAKIENILSFQKDYPQAKVFKLEQNYRSTQTIVDAANSIIEKNQHRIKKQVFSENNIGEPIKVLKAYTDGEDSMDIDVELGRLSEAVSSINRALGMPAPVISFEPGRWIVAPAGVTLYRVGTVKPVQLSGDTTDKAGNPVTERVYVSVDGGMSDNIRPEDQLPEEEIPIKPMWQIQKEGWYDKVNLTVRQLDIIIGCGIAGLILTFIAIALDAMGVF